MTTFLLEMPIWLLGLIIVGASVLVTLAGARLFSSVMSDPTDNPAVTALHATVATIYTVLLAFVVVIVWQQFTDAGSEVVAEATRLSNILRDSQVMEADDHASMQRAIGDYIRLTSTREWESMSEGRGADPQANAAYHRIWDTAYTMNPQGVVQESFYQEMIGRMNELGTARRTRLLSAQASVPQLLWLLLIAGAGVVIVLSYYLPHGAKRGSTFALSSTSCVIALTLFLIFVMDHPYTGNFSVDPAPLTELLPRTESTPEVDDSLNPS